LASKQFDKEQVAKSLELYQVLKDLRRENGFLTEEFQKQLDAVTDYLKEYEKVSKEVEKTTKRIKDQNKFLDDTEDILGSIADKVGKTSKLYKDGENYLKAQKVQLSSIADFTQQIGDEDFAKSAEKAVEAYKKYQKSVAVVADRTSFTGKRQEEANIAIARARAEYEQSVSFLGDMGEEGQFVLSTLNDMANQTDKFGASVTATTEEWKAMDAVLSNFSGVPAMSELNTLLKTNIKDTIAFKAAVFALGAALGKAAMDYFGAPIKTAMEQYKQIQQNRIDTEGNIGKLQVDAQSIPKQIEQERLETRINSEGEIAKLQQEAAFAGAKAAIQFSAQMQSGAAAFERAAKTALFGNKIGSVGYGAAQLQLAGISADKIASGMEAASEATGRMPSARVGADMSIMAERTGTSVDNIASINEMFQRMDGASESTAMNLSEGLRNMADQAGIGLGGLMREIAEASKDALSYQIKSGPALAKQVAYAKSLGVNFGDIAKAGKSMVMNYKDSIKNEMQLSAMLGKNVDLSEVRAKFASGDTEGAMKSLQAQGLDPAQMDMFAQEQLSQALGGMDLNSLQKISKNQGAQVGGLKEGSAKAGNQDFLSRTQSAESAMNMKQASISASTAILDAQLSQKIADSYLASDDYKTLKKNQNLAAQEAEKLAGAMNEAWIKSDAFAKQMTESTKLGFVTGLLENIVSGIAMLLGGSILSKVMGGGGGGVMKMLGGMIPGGGGGGAAAPSGGAAPGGAPDAMAGAAPGGAKPGGAGMGKSMVDGMKQVSTVIKGVVKELSGVLKSIITELSGVLQQGVKLVTDVSNKIAEGVMKTFNTVVGGLKQASAQLPSILGNLGKAIGAFFSGMTAGLTTFAMAMAAPTPLFGLPVGLIVVGMAMGLAKAFSIAGPGIEALTPLLLGLADIIGGTFVKAMQAAGPIITAIFDGIAKVIKTIGDAISGVILSITDSISRLSGLDASQMGAVALGITAMAGAVAIFGGASAVGGFMSAVGSFFGGDPVEKFRNFQNLDAAQLTAVADAIKYLGTGIASFVIAPTIAESVAALGKGFDEFADYLNDGEIETMNAFSSALIEFNAQLMQTAALSGAISITANAVQSLANAFGSLNGINTSALNDIPWGDMEDFASEGGKFVLASSGGGSFALSKDTTDNIKKMATNTEAMVKLNNTMAKLLKEGFFGSGETSTMKLYIDGKDVNSSMKRYKSNTENQDPKKK
jgi:hypothetical protein